MIRETATVVAIDGDSVTVEAAIKSTCNACEAQSDCGTGVISRAIAPKTQQLTLRTPMPVRIGQKVTVGIPEAGILSASAWLYLLPLVEIVKGKKTEQRFIKKSEIFYHSQLLDLIFEFFYITILILPISYKNAYNIISFKLCYRFY